MCGRFTLTSTPEDLALRFGLDSAPELSPRYNIAPGQDVLAVRLSEDERKPRAASLRWGLVPPWAKSPEVGYRMINARSETAAEKPAFREAFRARRCLLPADGFYEWAQRGDLKQPYHIALAGGGLFGFAALWERWREPEGAWLESCAILTTDACPGLRDLHDRMPVILGRDEGERWLDPDVTQVEPLLPLLRPLPDAALRLHPVSVRVNSARVDDAACLAPVPEPPRQESLF